MNALVSYGSDSDDSSTVSNTTPIGPIQPEPDSNLHSNPNGNKISISNNNQNEDSENSKNSDSISDSKTISASSDDSDKMDDDSKTNSTQATSIDSNDEEKRKRAALREERSLRRRALRSEKIRKNRKARDERDKKRAKKKKRNKSKFVESSDSDDEEFCIPNVYKDAKEFALFIQKHKELKLDDILPKQPEIGCDAALNEKIEQALLKKRQGFSFLDSIEANKNFRNPEYYNSLLEKTKIDEFGSNFPKVDALSIDNFDASCYYDKLREEQSRYMEELTKRRNRTNQKRAEALNESRKSKWESTKLKLL